MDYKEENNFIAKISKIFDHIFVSLLLSFKALSKIAGSDVLKKKKKKKSVKIRHHFMPDMPEQIV